MLKFRNEFIMAPIKTGYSDGMGNVTPRHLSFYTKRAEYLGAIILEPLYLDKRLREIPTQIGIDSDEKIAGLTKLNEAIHEKGCSVIAHLNHPGRMANPKIPGNIYWSSVAKACENGGKTPIAIDQEKMAIVREQFVAAARRAEQAKFDAIELQFGHGYLLAQFLSPAVNARTDEYGGSFSNRMKFPLEVLSAVKDATSLPIIARISGDEMIPNGLTITDMIAFSKKLKEASVEAIHVSAGTICTSPPWFFQHMFVPKGKTWALASELKQNVALPIIFVGQVNTTMDIDFLLQEKKADYVAIGRGLVADPDFIGKYLGKVKGTIMPCLACVEGCLGGVKKGKGLQCLVNPAVDKNNLESTLTPIDEKKKYAVVGGGLAGMEAACILKERGHDVDLFEKNTLGGQFRYAHLTPNKKSMEKLIPAFIERLTTDQVTIIHKEANTSDLLGKYDAVIIATGSRPKIPDIKGLEKYYWSEIMEKDKLPSGKKIMIIGGGLIGVDIATALIQKGNQVILVKRSTDFGTHMEMIAKNLSLKMLKEKDTVFSDHTFIQEINGSTVRAIREEKEIVFEGIDAYVVSIGMESYRPLAKELEDKMPVYIIGDAKEVGDAQAAIRSAFELACSL
ncbi:MAG: NAD(P)/FAD-dependent oxidoreductase [Candidatus Heimdallarchaeota archaeon]|nr:NAD(P)/FAD-dependent oxidoreductase [Candidatus Heimdallarchaeota archaeon]